MGLKEDVLAEVDAVLATAWDLRKSEAVPAAEDVALGSGAVEIDAAMLYADLAESTKIAMTLPAWLAAEIAKAFLATSCRIIRHHGGHIRSFDGDRVMGVFVGSDRCAKAAKASLQINWAVVYVLRPKFAKYPSISANDITIQHGVGIDAGSVFVARTGIRRNNDLVWIGRAPNVAAKLAAIRERNFSTYITKSVFSQLDDRTWWHYPPAGGARQLMWEERSWPQGPTGLSEPIYRSSWSWGP
ncbi:adenylate/guanylate cyclase domain-containing protein [Stenotrophomonas sp.]|uniref:adenylate/guanylate cyclase domain-containing protein n=1 Tax=Stenotrophomonas sp. TaxID=69392 RepID=UPI002D305CE5|nr:adenylate/guanylate cyclase domain-containing protein [Stenotrophomonas sp.]HYQ23980.1 adenylate/guanylate cyclase domain-containing protein [Stenotrophomonas sp.]